MLLADVEGDDQYDAAEPELLEMVSMLVDLQVAWIGRVDDLLAIGLPDWRGPALTARIADVVGKRSAEVSDEDRATLAAFVDGPPGPVRRDRWHAESRTRSSTATTTRATCAACPAG